MTVNKVLVIGGGVTGSVAAIRLAQKGVKVTLIDTVPEWYGVGHGLTAQGNLLKVMRDIGALDRIMEHAMGFNEVKINHADGHTLTTLQTPRTGGEDLPATAGVLRSDLQTVLVDMIHELGIDVRLSTEMDSFVNLEDCVDVTFNNGTTENFDLVIGADGISAGRNCV